MLDEDLCPEPYPRTPHGRLVDACMLYVRAAHVYNKTKDQLLQQKDLTSAPSDTNSLLPQLLPYHWSHLGK